MTSIPLTGASLLVLVATTLAQTPTPLVLTGDALPGGGVVTGIGAVNVDFFGDWFVEVTTDAPGQPSLLLRSTGPWKQIGDPVSDPAGATIAAYDSFSTELFGAVTFVARLDGTPLGTADDEAVYFESMLWLREGPVLPWPVTNLPDGTSWLSFDDVRCSSSAGGVLFRGRLDDPTLPGPDENYLAYGQIAAFPGNLQSVDRVVSDGQLAPGLTATIASVNLAPAAAAIAPNGEWVVWSCQLRDVASADACVYRYSVSGHELLAREGSPSPVAGRTWGSLQGIAVAVDGSGTYTMRATLDASDLSNDAVIVKNTTVVAREGGVLPSVAPAVVTGFDRGPALLDDVGRVLWYGRLSGPEGATSEALFLDDQVLVRTGVTQVAGRTLVGIDGGIDALSLDPSGELLVFTGRLAGGIEGAFWVELGGP